MLGIVPQSTLHAIQNYYIMFTTMKDGLHQRDLLYVMQLW